MIDFIELFPDNRHEGNSDLRKAQLVMLRILKIIDHICRENNIRYWLDGGTLLGAVRHQGFIPWDDDLDIAMPREDFYRFVEIAPRELPKDLFLQTAETDPEYIVFGKPPCKIRDRYSQIIEVNNDSEGLYQGIFVDIFPVDRFHRSKAVFYYERFLKNGYRYLSSFYNAYDSNDKGAKSFLRKIASYAKKIVNVKPILTLWYSILQQRIEKNLSLKDDYFLGLGFEIVWLRIYEPSEIFPLQKISFEGSFFDVPNNFESVLTQYYGDFMTMPRESERGGHHATHFIIDTRCL